MLGKSLSTMCAVALGCAPCVSPAATFDVSTPAEFQSALTAAASNGQNDTINVEECLGAGCATVGQFSVYDIVTPLTFTSAEGLSLTIDGFDSDTRILRGGSNNNSGILFIDTTGASNDFAAEIVVRGLTIGDGNNVGDNGGGLNVHVNSARVEVSGSVFGGNAADGNGGALYIRAEQASEFPIQIFDVTFDTNSAGGGGGGAHVSGTNGHMVEISDVFFWDNDAANGGGLEVEGLDPDDLVPQVASLTLFDIDFDDNIARTGNGGGADIAANFIDISVVGFVRNLASSGSGAGLYVRRSLSNFQMVNTGLAYNTAGLDGGGFAFAPNMGPTITITNNTIYGNEAPGRGGGGLLTIGGSTGWARAYNNIIYANTGANAGDDIYVDNDPFADFPAVVDFYNNNITDLAGFPANAYFEVVSATELNSDANLGGNPMLTLMTREAPDPSQSQNSQTIDMGDVQAPGVPDEDYEGDVRPSGSGTDIGMDEYVAGTLPETDLSVTKTDSPDPVIGGTNVTYTVTVTNNGPNDATGVTIVDTLDVNSTFVSAVFNQGTPCTTAGTPPQQATVVTCVLGPLAANNSAPGTIVVASSDDPLVTGIANSVRVSGNETDSTPANNTAQQGTTVVQDTGPPQADLAVSKIDTPDPLFSGGPVLTYTITVDNNGPDSATGITLTDTLPVEAVFQSATTQAGTCDAAPINGDIDCSLDDLASGSNATVTIVVDPDDVTSADTISNTAIVSASTEDPNLTNNSVTEVTVVNPPGADMSVETTHTPDSPMVNEEFTYRITVDNDGPSDNTGVGLTVTLPASATFESVSIEQGSCDVSGDTVTCDIGDMASGVSVAAEIIVTAPGESMTLMLSATLVADVADPNPEDNASSEAVIVIDVVDLIIEGESEGTGSASLLELLFAAIVGIAVYWHRRCEATRRVLSAIGPVAIAVLLSLPAQQALAQNQWYLGANIGASDADYSSGELQSDLASLGWTINNPSVDDTDTAWKAYVGYTFNQYIAVEGGFADLGEVETRYGATVAPDQIDTILLDTYRIHPVLGDGWFGAVVLSWPVSPDRFSLTARAGFIGWETDIDVEVVQGGTGSVSDRDSGTDMLYGLGAEWHLNQQWSITAEWERYELKDWVDVPSVGVKFKF